MLEKKIQDILDRMPKITDLAHAFYSEEAHQASKGEQTATMSDEFGKTVRVSFVGGCSIDGKGNIIPSLDEEPLSAPPQSYRYIGYIDMEKQHIVRTDHSPEIPKYHLEM